MDWTGSIYFFYSDKNIKKAFEQITFLLKKIGYLYEHNYDELLNEQTLLCFKNKLMLKQHMEKGYHLDAQNEGCIGIEAKKISLNGVATMHTYEKKRDFIPYDICFCFSETYHYTLVLPEDIEKSEFCENIYNAFANILIT